MNWLDFGIILILSVSVLYSLFRGLAREVFSLLSLILGVVAASKFYSFLAGFFLTWISSKVIANILGFIFIFIAVSLAISLLGRLVRRSIRVIRLESVDRIMGGLFGFLKGVLIVMVFILVIGAFLPPAHPLLKNSKLSPYFATLGEVTLDIIPDNFGERVREKREGPFRKWEDAPENQGNFWGGKYCSFIRRNNAFSFFRISFA